ncbi:MAG TPA: extracellular solute-binding protein [Methylomirabilota bacterium]|jgi:putative spermidine/putrescine transport system substrate-binding protein|nr:extracellular solute-binding protein [Methylomirabilota bacterium]
MKRSLLIALVLSAVAAAATLPQPPAVAQGKTLVVTGYGGRWSEVMKKALVAPFEQKYDARVEIVTGITTEWVAKLMAAGPDNPPFDVVMGNEPPLPIPRDRGFFDKRNPAAAPNIKNVYDKALIGDTSLAIFWGRIGLAYRTDMGLKPPKAWKDFWDPSYDGKRGIYVIGNTLGINFLFMTDKIFGKDYFDVDAGIGAIKKLNAKMVDFTGTMTKHLESKEVAIAVLNDSETYDLAKRGIPVDWVPPSEGVPILDQVIQVTKGSKNKDLAWKLIDMYLSPEVQTAFATELFFSPTNKTVKLPPDVAKKTVSGPADVEKLTLFDWNQVAKQRPQWTERWNKELR